MDAKKTGALIAQARHELNLTQKELASRLNVSDRAVSKWERGAGFPDVSLLEPLAAELGLTSAELLKGERVPGTENTNEIIRDAVRLARKQLWAALRRNAAAILIVLLFLWIFGTATRFWDRIMTRTEEIDCIVTAGIYTADGEKVTSETIATADLAEVQAKWVSAEEISEATAEDYDPQLTHAGKAYKSSSNKSPLERQYSVGSVVLRALNKGFVLTLKLFAITLLGALPLGLLISFGSMSKFAPLKYVTKTIVWIFRGSPLLLQLMIVFYMPGLLFGVNPWAFSDGRFWAAATAFILNYACYFSEIYRGGIQSVPVGQTEAGLVLGMTKTQIFFKVKLMQLVKRILPPMSNEIITLVKDTSLANTIGLLEVIYQGKSFMKSDGLIWPLFFTGVYYLAFTGILTLFLGWLERKLNYFRV